MLILSIPVIPDLLQKQYATNNDVSCVVVAFLCYLVMRYATWILLPHSSALQRRRNPAVHARHRRAGERKGSGTLGVSTCVAWVTDAATSPDDAPLPIRVVTNVRYKLDNCFKDMLSRLFLLFPLALLACIHPFRPHQGTHSSSLRVFSSPCNLPRSSSSHPKGQGKKGDLNGAFLVWRRMGRCQLQLGRMNRMRVYG